MKFFFKKLSMALLLCLVQFTYAQTEGNAFANDMDRIFGKLELQRVPHGILMDCGFDVVEVTNYDGILRSTNYVNGQVYKELYTALATSAVKTNIPGIKSPITAFEDWGKLKSTHAHTYNNSNTAGIALSGLFFNYSKIRSDALSKELIRVVNNTYDDAYKGSVWQNPYTTKQVFALGAGVTNIVRPSVKVNLPTALWYSNSSIKNIHINFGNGSGYKSLKNGSVATTNYTQNGTYTWTYRIQLTNNKYLYARQQMRVALAETSGTSCSGTDQQRIMANKAFKGKKGSATLQISYGNTCGKIRKPLIVAEGLDTGLQVEAGSIGDTDLGNFKSSLVFSSTNLKGLINNDYDIIYVNWDNGTDWLQRNAYVLEEVIAWVNKEKALAGSTEPNVVLGQSMGGVIARYALSNMEKIGANHDTSLYISHDAPHQGAHLPPSILYLSRHLVKQVQKTPVRGQNFDTAFGNASSRDLRNLLDAPAVSQLVRDYVDSSLRINRSAYNLWQTELKAMGYPRRTRNIAISNASHCGGPQIIKPNESIIKIAGSGRSGWLTDVLLNVLSPVNSILTGAIAVGTQEPGFLLNFLPGSSKLDVLIDAKAYPSSGNKRIYIGEISYTKKLLWLIPIKTTLTKEERFSNGATLVDTYPGGIQPNAEVSTESNTENNVFVVYDFNVTNNSNFSFIPVTSALDVGSGRTTLTKADQFKNYNSETPPTGNKAIPFINFTTSFNPSGLNEEHLSFNFRNANWLASELDEISGVQKFNCEYFCDSASISGPNTLCDQANYTFPLIGNRYTWRITEGARFVKIVSSDNNKLTLKNQNRHVYITIQLTVDGDCGRSIKTKRVWLGKPKLQVLRKREVCTSTDLYLEYEVIKEQNLAGVTYEYWYNNFPRNKFSGRVKGKIAQINVPKTSNVGDVVTIRFTTSNTCGSSTTHMVESLGCDKGNSPGNGGGFQPVDPSDRFKPKILNITNDKENFVTEIFPNPFVNFLNIKVGEGLGLFSGLIQVFDFGGKIVKEFPINYNISQLNLEGLSSGVYILKVKSKENIYIEKIVKQ